jgi:hypothetical protein
VCVCVCVCVCVRVCVCVCVVPRADRAIADRVIVAPCRRNKHCFLPPCRRNKHFILPPCRRRSILPPALPTQQTLLPPALSPQRCLLPLPGPAGLAGGSRCPRPSRTPVRVGRPSESRRPARLRILAIQLNRLESSGEDTSATSRGRARRRPAPPPDTTGSRFIRLQSPCISRLQPPCISRRVSGCPAGRVSGGPGVRRRGRRTPGPPQCPVGHTEIAPMRAHTARKSRDRAPRDPSDRSVTEVTRSRNLRLVTARLVTQATVR